MCTSGALPLICGTCLQFVYIKLGKSQGRRGCNKVTDSSKKSPGCLLCSSLIFFVAIILIGLLFHIEGPPKPLQGCLGPLSLIYYISSTSSSGNYNRWGTDHSRGRSV
uniref:Uncharacterized protein n=1 Tax=Schistocephalus solidus TaxID=70667 RepID=A0A0X3P839_SCHSO